MKTKIKTTIDPKEIRAKYGTILCRDGELEVTATTEIIGENFDPKTHIFTMEVGLHYSRRSSRPTIIFAGPPDYMMTQGDFDAVTRGEVIRVPARY